MKHNIGLFFMIFIFIVVIALCVLLTMAIVNSGMPEWLKTLILKK